VAKKRGSGLVLTSHHPKLGYFALLSRRGTYNWETMTPESYPGACQVTCHGGLEEGEDFRAALFRESGQELGIHFANALRLHESELRQVGYKNDDRAEVVTEGLHVDFELIEMIFADRGSANFVPCTMEQARNMRKLHPKDDKEKGVTDGSIAMFGDEMEAVVQALDDIVGS